MPGRRSRIAVRVLAAAGVLLSVAAATSCGSGASDREAAAGDQMVQGEGAVVEVFAAASLAAAFGDLARAFERTADGTPVRLNAAGSSALAQQIVQGARPDVFASADTENMAIVRRHGDLVGSPRIFASNTLAIVVERGNPKGIRTLADLERPGLKLALGAPRVPIGRYTTDVFARARLRRPPSSEEADVRAIVTKVKLGEVDAGVVYATDLRAAGSAVGAVPIPRSENVAAEYPIARVKGGPTPTAAAAFVEFVLSGEGQRLLVKHGFGAGR